MLLIHLLTRKTVRRFVDFNLCFLILIITCCNIFSLSCFADEKKEVSSATEISIENTEISTESITEVITEEVTEATEATEETTETLNREEESEVFYYRFIVVLLIIILFILIISKLF